MIRGSAVAAAALLVSGCASFSPDGGFDQVSALTRERVGQAPTMQRTASDTDSARTRISQLLQQPLQPDAAVELAFLNNRGLQASFAELGIAESELVRAGRLRNPSFSYGRMREGHGAVEIERAVMFDVLGLLMMPLTRQVQQRRLEQVQLRAAEAAVGLASDVRRAYFGAVAAQELVTYYQQVQEAAEASAELARRMGQAGNFNKLSSCASSRSMRTRRRSWPRRAIRSWPSASAWPG